MQFWVEILIERVFETVQTLIHYVLSPFNTLKLFISWLFFSHFNREPDHLVDTSTLGDSNPAIQKQARRQQSLNTDERTCEDVITALGWVASFSLGCSLWIIASYQFSRPRLKSCRLWLLRSLDVTGTHTKHCVWLLKTVISSFSRESQGMSQELGSILDCKGLKFEPPPFTPRGGEKQQV